mmetsp:Transcript_82430/g.251894  ORF Transcript_82430/g.251894 Transcript_82430/m.251894 type:complete len:158 (-) Transcript_82430:251-724(-)
MALVELFGETLVTKDGPKPTAEALSGCTQIGVYFSAHWCPPCRAFTPKLAEKFKNDYEAKGLKVVFVSSDRNEQGFNEYYGEMPWHALPYGSDRKETLSRKYGVQGIPMFVILDPEGNLLSADGRGLVSQGAAYPWSPGGGAGAGAGAPPSSGCAVL